MSDREQIAAFEKDLKALVSRYAQEFEVSVAGIIGTLQLEIMAVERKQREATQ